MAQQQHKPEHAGKYNDIYLSIDYNSVLDNWAQDINIWGISSPVPTAKKVINNHYLYTFDEPTWTVAGANINFMALGFNGHVYLGNLEDNDVNDALSSSTGSDVPNALSGLTKKYAIDGKYEDWSAIKSEQEHDNVLHDFNLFGILNQSINKEKSTISAQKSGVGQTQKMKIITYGKGIEHGPPKKESSQTQAFDNGANKALNYVGCYKDTGNRAIPCYVGTGSIDWCIGNAKNPPTKCGFTGPANVMGIQYGGSSDHLPQCFLDQDPDPNLTAAKQHGGRHNRIFKHNK